MIIIISGTTAVSELQLSIQISYGFYAIFTSLDFVTVKCFFFFFIQKKIVNLAPNPYS
jgi:hypothetical protein